MVRAAEEKGEQKRNDKDLRRKTAERGSGQVGPIAETNAKQGPWSGVAAGRRSAIEDLLFAPRCSRHRLKLSTERWKGDAVRRGAFAKANEATSRSPLPHSASTGSLLFPDRTG